jgi:hypothetical protein
LSIVIRKTGTVQGALTFGTALTPPALTGNTNNYNPADLDSTVLLRLSSTRNFSLTGIVPPDITEARMIFLYNVGTNNIKLKNNDASSDAENRFLFGSNKNIQPDEGLGMVYDPVSLRWRAFGINI